MLHRARAELLNKVDEYEDVVDTDMKQGEEREWTTGVPEVPEEEAESYVPVQFESVLNYMEVSYEEARKIYLDMIESHIGPLLADCVEIRKLLRSDLAMDRYVPKEWSGIKTFQLSIRCGHVRLTKVCWSLRSRSSLGCRNICLICSVLLRGLVLLL